MKTNQEMIRPMGDFKVIQRTKDGFFNATELLKQWNVSNCDERRELDNFWKAAHLNELMSEIAKNELNITSVDFTVLKRTLSKTNKARLDRGGGTWMHPILFIKFAMYLSPRFEYHVIKFVYDEMIKFRNLAGDAYPSMCRAVRSIMPEPIFREKVKDLARSLNIIVYGRHESEMRNKVGDESKIREMYELERQIAQWINIGLVGNYKQLKTALNKLYYQKYPNALPI